MAKIPIKEEEKVRACYIKANRPFRIWIEDKYTLPLPEQEKDGKFTYILTPEYCWYKLGKEDRDGIKEKLKKHYNKTTYSIDTNKEEEMTPEQIKKAKDVLKYRSPTFSQLMWIVDLNKLDIKKVCFPQAFWDFTKAKIEIEPSEADNEFEYQIGSI